MEFFYSFVFILVLINSVLTGLGQEVCDSNTGPVCCDGYYRDQNTGSCIRCKPGHFDINCSKTCGYPTYGEQCQKICSCPKKKCHFSYGCIASDENILYQSSSGLFNKKSRLSLLKPKHMNRIIINADRYDQMKDRSTSTLSIPSVRITGNESSILKTNFDMNASDYRSISSAIIIAITICATLLTGVIITVTIIVLGKYACNRKETFRQKDDGMMSVPMMSEYDELHNRNSFLGVAAISVAVDEIG